MANITYTATAVQPGAGAVTTPYTFGATVTQAQAVYLDPTTNKLALASALSAVASSCIGLVLNAGSDGQPGNVQYGGVINLGSGLTVGQVYAVSATAGAIAPYADLVSTNFVTILGVAISTALLKLSINVSGIAK